ncbi:MAG: hypothetical protein Q8N44_11515 [Rubrivivax sp.]|nr:hypothetical protein [Rubrivivax sp.]
MPLHIGEIQTDIQLIDDEPGGAAAAPAPVWQQLAQLRGLFDHLLSDSARTSASGNED